MYSMLANINFSCATLISNKINFTMGHLKQTIRLPDPMNEPRKTTNLRFGRGSFGTLTFG